MTTELARGGNVILGNAAFPAILVGVDWSSGDLECDLSVIVCGPDRQALSDAHFVFFNQPITPERAVFLREQGQSYDGARDRAQVQVHLAGLPEEAQRLVISLATLVPGQGLTAVTGARVALRDPADGRDIATYEVGGGGSDPCLVLTEVYRHADTWRARAMGQGYAQGLAGLGRDYGVETA